MDDQAKDTKYTQYTTEQLNRLDDMAQEAAKIAGISMGKLIRQDIKINTVAVKNMELSQLTSFVGDAAKEIAAIILDISSLDVKGSIMIIYDKQSAVNVADLLAKKPLGSSKSLSEVDKNALEESGNIIAGSFLTSLSNYTGLNMLESIPKIVIGKLKETFDEVAKNVHAKLASTIAFEIDFEMGSSSQGDAVKIVPEIRIHAYCVLILDQESSEALLQALEDK
jgi:chemotaxis protein CheC